MKKVINEVAGTITFSFDDGLEPVTFDVAKASEATRAYATLHGFMARIGDNAAIQKSAENNFRVTETMRREAVVEMVNHYHSGTDQWSVRTPGKPKQSKQSSVILAIAAKRGCTYEEAERWVAEKMLAELGA